VGYPIVPGFDFAGTVLAVGPRCRVRLGERVMGVTFFGGYSQRLVVPHTQLRPVPRDLSQADAAAFSSVAGTALHALALAGFWPGPSLRTNRAVLVHSAAGGVGSMLVQMARLLGCKPIVAVVGAAHKAATCREIGADVVIDKSSEDLWKAAERAAPAGFVAIFDANGVATLAQSYAHLARTGTLVIYGFHTNLPSTGLLNPLAWARMAFALFRLPRFDALDLVLNSRSVVGFNLSFFADERALLDAYMDQIHGWVDEGKLALAKVTHFAMRELPLAHDLIQSGQSVGKIVCMGEGSAWE
jgi:NADPH:quinone reductase-like Zn-dependent oxidoreductase